MVRSSEVMMLGSLPCRAFLAIRHFIPKRESSSKIATLVSVKDTVPSSSSNLAKGKDELDRIQSLTEIAIYRGGTEKGLEALVTLAGLCSNRVPFDFGGSGTSRKTVEKRARGRNQKLDQMVVSLPRLLPPSTTNSFLKSVKDMEAKGWLSTNPDSVDGLPSLHLNLVSDGKPLFLVDGNVNNTSDDTDDVSYQAKIRQLYNLVQPCIYDTLLPAVRQLLNETSITVSDIFLRRYGQDVCHDVTRNGISAHYDVFSRVTAVVALDDVAADGRNGLYTSAVDDANRRTSNHKALRRFFPLRTGDCVVHTWDVLHGVDVEAGLDRTSLIVWFTEDYPDKASRVPPWLTKHPDLLHENDVLQFVLASALSSICKSDSPDTGFEEVETNEVLLYLRSASQGNIFALTRMGSLCEEGALSSSMQQNALTILEGTRPFEQLPLTLRDMLAQRRVTDDDHLKHELAIRFWLEGALGGSPLAQRALADEVMFDASQSGNSAGRVLAAVLFALAAQQDDEISSDSLARVVEFDLDARNIDSQEGFLASPVVQVAKAAHG